MQRITASIFFGFFTISILAAEAGASVITTGTLLEEMTDLGGLACWPEPAYRTIQVSSFDRRSTTSEAPGLVLERRRLRPRADISEGCISTAACVLANLSLQLGRSLTWDEPKGQVAGDTEANQLLARPYRAPWVHPVPEKV